MSNNKNNTEAATLSDFERDLLASIRQAQRGEYARVHTAEELTERIAAKKRGRPAGSTQAVTKKPTTLRLDESTLQLWRASGKGWQTRAAAVLAQYAPRD